MILPIGLVAGLGGQALAADNTTKPASAALASGAAAPNLSESARKFIALVAIAVRAHPGVNSAGVVRAQKQDEHDIAFASLLPQVQGGFTGGYNHENPPSVVGLPANRVDAVASISQLVYDFGAAFDRLDEAKSNEQAAEFQFRAASNTYALKAVQAYFDVLRYRELATATKDYQGRVQGLLNSVQERAESGAGSTVDTLRAKALLAEANSRLADVNARASRAEANYREVFNEPAGVLVAPDLDLSRIDRASEGQQVAQARQKNPTLMSQKAALDAAGFEASASKEDVLPKVQFTVNGTKYDATFAGHNDPLNYEFSAGFNVIYKLYSGGADEAKAREAGSKRDQLRFDYDRAAGELDRDTRLAVADLHGQSQHADAADLALQAEQASVSARREQFEAGRAQFMDLLNGQAGLYTASVEATGARYDVMIDRYSLMALTGELLEFFGVGN